jgi:hypothetical protein
MSVNSNTQKKGSVNSKRKFLEHSDIECYEFLYGDENHMILSFVFLADSPTKAALQQIKNVLSTYVGIAKKKNTEFSIYIDGTKINRPSFASITNDFTTDIEKITVGSVRKTTIVVNQVVKLFLKASLKTNKPKTPTHVYTDNKKAWNKIIKHL